MTEQTALEWLKVLNSWSTLRDEPKEACELAIDALEKQIAEKVETRLETRDGYYWKCPICDYNIVRFSYCPNCGQKLDWSEV